MRRDAGRAVIRMAPLRLDAADRHHGFAADVDGVAAQSKCEECGFRKTQFARSDEEHALVQTLFGEDPQNAAETHLEWQRDVIREHERPRPGAPFTAINRNEVDTARTT